jgi:UDP-N-acetylglucosamine 2-epimerase (non-hydrolysing)
MSAVGKSSVLLVFGTRPEAIKMAPIVKRLSGSPTLKPEVVVTGQHREMLDQVLQLFDIVPTADLDVIVERQTLTGVTTAVLSGLAPLLESTQPAAIVVQGDTTTTMATALAAYYARIPVVHVEAGLRTNDRWSPYPEEINRRLVSQLASLHLAPTEAARANLLAEAVDKRDIVLTGNSVIDALLWTVDACPPYTDPRLDLIDGSDRRVLVVTLHRRESWGAPMRAMADAVRRLALARPDLQVVLPMHRNPVVREAIMPLLADCENVLLTEPLDYGPFARLMKRADVLLTDSGGIQEEGPALGKPVLVMRDVTERPEAIEAGVARLVGTDPDVIFDGVAELLDNSGVYSRMATAVNPFGDGRAAERTEAAIARFLGLSDLPVDEFVA